MLWQCLINLTFRKLFCRRCRYTHLCIFSLFCGSDFIQYLNVYSFCTIFETIAFDTIFAYSGFSVASYCFSAWLTIFTENSWNTFRKWKVATGVSWIKSMAWKKIWWYQSCTSDGIYLQRLTVRLMQQNTSAFVPVWCMAYSSVLELRKRVENFWAIIKLTRCHYYFYYQEQADEWRISIWISAVRILFASLFLC